MKITKSELKKMIREALREELLHKGLGDNTIAFIDFTGSSYQFEDLYKKALAADEFKGTVHSVEDLKMQAVQNTVNSGANVVLYTCDDDYVYNCPSIINKPNFKVRLVKPGEQPINEVYLVGEDEGDYSSYRASIEGSTKRLIGKGEKDGLALRKIVEFINKLSKEEKDNFSLSWRRDEDFGDGEGDVIVSVYSLNEISGMDERTISNWTYAENCILNALGLIR